MTVSPLWPQDGSSNPSDAADGVQGGNPTSSPALPPTLFKLRDLGPGEPSPQGHDRSSDAAAVVAPPLDGPSPPSEEMFAMPSQPDSDSPSNRAAAPVHQPDDAQQDTPRPAPASQQPTTESGSDSALPTAFPVLQPPAGGAAVRDAPAGRTWMESIGSHSVVVVLLLIVVAAALVTGRGSQPQDENLTEHGQLLDFADGADVDLPIPDQHGSQTDIASSSQLQGSPVQQTVPYSELDDASADENDPDVPSGWATLDASELTAVQPESSSEPASVDFDSYLDAVDVSADPTLTTLDAPQAPATQADALAMDPAQTPIQTKRVQVNELTGDRSGGDAVAATSNKPTDSGRFDLPSLEDLAADAESAMAAQAASASPTPRTSKTPLGIEDLLRARVHQYVPEATSQAANSNTSN